MSPDPVSATMLCRLCPDVMPVDELPDHVRLIHPDHGGVERWPNGDVVVVDLTLTPSDFGGVR